jgi:citrate lyase beta subunit
VTAPPAPPALTGRRPIQTAYVGAHLFRAGLAAEWGELALTALSDCAPDAASLAAALDCRVDEQVFARLGEKLRREPIEDLRIDFEDGFGSRSDQEEDGAARSAGAEVAAGLARKSLPSFLGIRIKALAAERAKRACRTLELFVTTLVERSGGKLPAHFTVTLPKVATLEAVAALVRLLAGLESRLHLEAGVLTLELMVETPRALLGPDGRCPLPALVAATRGRCVGLHFGVYDYLAALEIAPSHHRLRHPACDHARHVIQVALAATGVVLSAGSTNVLPVPPRDHLLRAWRLHFQDVRHSLVSGFYHGWDLHPAQLVTRYLAAYGFFRECLESTAGGSVLEDPAARGVRASLVGRAVDCGAINDDEARAALP